MRPKNPRTNRLLIANLIECWCAYKNMRLRFFSDSVGIEYQRLLALRKGQDSPSLSESCKLAKFMDVPEEDLFTFNPRCEASVYECYPKLF